MYIYALIRKVINIYKIWKKKKKKIFRKANHSRHFARSLPPPPLLLKIIYFLCYVISYNLTEFVKIFVFFFLYNVMLLIFGCTHNYLIFSYLRAYFSVCYFIPSQLSLRIFMQFLLYIYPYPHFKHFLILFLKFINILKHI